MYAAIVGSNKIGRRQGALPVWLEHTSFCKCYRALLAMAVILLHPGVKHGVGPIAHSVAHAHLSMLRSSMNTDEESRDLTHAEDFDWKRYVSHHAQSRDLIGVGAIGFEIRFINGWDSNMGEHRCDFVVLRADGTAARLHPSSKKAGSIVIGRLQDWLLKGHSNPVLLAKETAGVAEHGQHIDGDAPSIALPIFTGVHQVDTLSRAEACVFLKENETIWRAKNDLHAPFVVDLMRQGAGHTTGSDFKWAFYLNSTPWGREMVATVEQFHLVWFKQKDRAGFWVSVQDGSYATIDPQGTHRVPIRWNGDAEEVSWI